MLNYAFFRNRQHVQRRKPNLVSTYIFQDTLKYAFPLLYLHMYYTYLYTNAQSILSTKFYLSFSSFTKVDRVHFMYGTVHINYMRIIQPLNWKQLPIEIYVAALKDEWLQIVLLGVRYAVKKWLFELEPQTHWFCDYSCRSTSAI